MPDSESGALPLGEFPTDDLIHSVMGMRGRNALNGISSQPPMFCFKLEVTTWRILNSSSECSKFWLFASFVFSAHFLYLLSIILSMLLSFNCQKLDTISLCAESYEYSPTLLMMSPPTSPLHSKVSNIVVLILCEL